MEANLIRLLNSASLQQLKQLHTIGDKRAKHILQAREEQPFSVVWNQLFC